MAGSCHVTTGDAPLVLQGIGRDISLGQLVMTGGVVSTGVTSVYTETKRFFLR